MSLEVAKTPSDVECTERGPDRSAVGHEITSTQRHYYVALAKQCGLLTRHAIEVAESLAIYSREEQGESWVIRDHSKHSVSLCLWPSVHVAGMACVVAEESMMIRFSVTICIECLG
jgi:hypothetical protein